MRGYIHVCDGDFGVEEFDFDDDAFGELVVERRRRFDVFERFVHQSKDTSSAHRPVSSDGGVAGKARSVAADGKFLEDRR